MNSRRTVLSYLIGIGCGYVYIYILAKLFGQVLNPNPINQWLLEYLAKAGHEVGYFVAIYAHDVLLYIIVAIPFALLLSRLPPKNEWKYLFVALATSLVVPNWILFAEPSRLAILAEHLPFYVGTVISILGLPIAFAIVTTLSRVANPTVSDTVEGA